MSISIRKSGLNKATTIEELAEAFAKVVSEFESALRTLESELVAIKNRL